MLNLRNVGIACSNNPLINNHDELFSFADNALLELKRQGLIALSFEEKHRGQPLKIDKTAPVSYNSPHGKTVKDRV
jgi:hypothetical protein